MSTQINLHVQIGGKIPPLTTQTDSDLRNEIRRCVFDVLQAAGVADCVVTIRGPEVVSLRD